LNALDEFQHFAVFMPQGDMSTCFHAASLPYPVAFGNTVFFFIAALLNSLNLLAELLHLVKTL
jgi:hypothetical protein